MRIKKKISLLSLTLLSYIPWDAPLDLFEALIGIAVFSAICLTMIILVCCKMLCCTEEIITVQPKWILSSENYGVYIFKKPESIRFAIY